MRRVGLLALVLALAPLAAAARQPGPPYDLKQVRYAECFVGSADA